MLFTDPFIDWPVQLVGENRNGSRVGFSLSDGNPGLLENILEVPEQVRLRHSPLDRSVD